METIGLRKQQALRAASAVFHCHGLLKHVEEGKWNTQLLIHKLTAVRVTWGIFVQESNSLFYFFFYITPNFSIQGVSFNLKTDWAATHLRQEFMQDSVCEMSPSVLSL